MYGTGTGLRVLFKIDQWAKGKTMKICAHAVGVIDIVLYSFSCKCFNTSIHFIKGGKYDFKRWWWTLVVGVTEPTFLNGARAEICLSSGYSSTKKGKNYKTKT